MGHFKFIIYGAPRTKKNSGQIITTGSRPRLLPSDSWRVWCRSGLVQLRQLMSLHKISPIDYPVNCKAIFYRERNVGDAANYYNGLADLLELSGLVDNDKYIISWDNSRLKKDALRPRVEFVLTQADEESHE